MLRVRAASGRVERFDRRKIYRTCIQAGASRKLAKDVVREVSSQLYDGIPTSKILDAVIDSLNRHNASDIAGRYDLKHAIMRMGPAGFAFETFLAEMLESYGYHTRLRQKVTGLYVEHEIDIVLEKGGERFMVEVKYHNAPGNYTGLKEVMYTHSRFLELKEGHVVGTCKRFDRAWLASNTRCSIEATKYAVGRGIHLLGWKYPRNQGIEKMIERKRLFPVTILRSLESKHLAALNRSNMMLVKDISDNEPEYVAAVTGLPLGEVRQLVHQARGLLKGFSTPKSEEGETRVGLGVEGVVSKRPSLSAA